MMSGPFPAVSAVERIVLYSVCLKGTNSTWMPGLRCSKTRIMRSYAHLSSGRQLQNVSLTAPCPLAPAGTSDATRSSMTSPTSHCRLTVTPPGRSVETDYRFRESLTAVLLAVASSTLGIVAAAQAFPKEVHAPHGGHDGQPRDRRRPGREVDVRPRVRQHRPPRRRRGRHAEAQER